MNARVGAGVNAGVVRCECRCGSDVNASVGAGVNVGVPLLDEVRECGREPHELHQEGKV